MPEVYSIVQYRQELSGTMPGVQGRHPVWGTVTEGQLLEFAQAVFRRNGWLVYHTSDSRRSEPGFPDLVAVKPPWVVFAELKTETGRFTRAQLRWLERVDQCSQVASYRWRPGDEATIRRVAERGIRD
jgi:hypothetical protein